MPIYLVPASYRLQPCELSISPQGALEGGGGEIPMAATGLEGVKVTSMGALLPDSFGPGSEEMLKEFEETNTAGTSAV